MKAQVICLRNEGKPRPRWQLGTLKTHIGELVIRESRSEELSRFMRSAHLYNKLQQKPDELLPPLIDAAVLWIKGNTMAITGFERIESTDYAQTWLIEIKSISIDE